MHVGEVVLTPPLKGVSLCFFRSSFKWSILLLSLPPFYYSYIWLGITVFCRFVWWLQSPPPSPRDSTHTIFFLSTPTIQTWGFAPCHRHFFLNMSVKYNEYLVFGHVIISSNLHLCNENAIPRQCVTKSHAFMELCDLTSV
jgi:hypothetical protein